MPKKKPPTPYTVHAPLIWVDMEMTGLDPKQDRIIEIAMIITDAQLNFIAQSPVVAIFQAPEVLANMDTWNKATHNKSGLLPRVQASTVDEDQATTLLLTFLKQHSKAQHSPMCGNSICQDRRFMYEYMPKLEAYFHYRNIDVSTLKELAKRWNPDIAKGFSKHQKHSALDDIQESIEELKYYREKIWRLEDVASPISTSPSL